MADIYHDTISEDRWRKNPTASDYKEVDKVLHDFDIHVKLPQFSTVRELSEFKNRMISIALENY